MLSLFKTTLITLLAVVLPPFTSAAFAVETPMKEPVVHTVSDGVINSKLEITDVRVREPIPGRMMSAAFFTITNTTEHSRTLVSVSADWAGLIEIHTHLHEDGVMKMRQLERLKIPAGDSVVLQPGGLHLMLFKLQLPLADVLPMELCFSNGECIETNATLFSPM